MAIAISSSSLRKACQICTKRKRKCIVGLPKCQRCRLRGLNCVYDLEPLVAGERTSIQRRKEPPRNFLDYISSLHLSHNIYACLVNNSLVHSLTAIPLTQDPEAVPYLIGELRRIPDLVRKRRHTPFIHVEWLRANSHKYLDLAPAATEDSSRSHLFPEFLAVNQNLDLETVPLTELVTVLQALILFLIRHAFIGHPNTPNGPVRLGFILLARGRTVLWRSGFQRMPHDLTPWHTWILAETVRRTILMSYLIEGTYSAWKAGWCTHRMFVYALPFSAQGRLWLASSEEEWTATALTSGQDTTTGSTAAPAMLELSSFKEFTLEFARTPFEPGDDLFQRLLLVSHHGKKSVEDRLARISREGNKPLITVMSFGASRASGG